MCWARTWVWKGRSDLVTESFQDHRSSCPEELVLGDSQAPGSLYTLRFGSSVERQSSGDHIHGPANSPCPFSLEYAENIGDGRSPEFRETEQKRILGLLENF